MADTSIRISEEAKRRLDLRKRDDESYDDVILRLTSDDRWAAFGIADGDVGEEMQDVREAARQRSADRIDEYDRD